MQFILVSVLKLLNPVSMRNTFNQWSVLHRVNRRIKRHKGNASWYILFKRKMTYLICRADIILGTFYTFRRYWTAHYMAKKCELCLKVFCFLFGQASTFTYFFSLSRQHLTGGASQFCLKWFRGYTEYPDVNISIPHILMLLCCKM